MKLTAIIFGLGLMAVGVAAVSAQSTADLNTQATTMNNLATSGGEANVVNKISADFRSFLGSDTGAIVSGLRNGTPITLKSTATTVPTTAGSTPTTTTTNTVIAPPTGHMGHGNVYISLALAKQQLGALGISQPTPQQLQAALTGGTITQGGGTTATVGGTSTMTKTELPGILTMRSQNMGWGQIAQKLGDKLGPVISGMKHANDNLAATSSTTSPSSSSTANQSTQSANRGIVSGSGQSQGNSGHGVSSGKGTGSGIVTASGRSSQGNNYGQGRSAIVTGSGQSGGVAGGAVSSGGGQNNGVGKGHNK